MRIALNAWFINQPTTGSGQYLVHLLAEYAAHHAMHRFLLCSHTSQVPPLLPTDAGVGSAPPGSAAHPDGTNPLPSCFEWQVLHTPFDPVHRHLAKLWFEQVGFPLACRRWGADLLHTPYWASPFFSHAPTVVTIHDLIPALLPAYRGGRLGSLYNHLVSLSARRAACVLTDSHASREDIILRLRIPQDRVVAIYLAADDHFRPVTDPALLRQVRERYGLPTRYLLYLGGFDVRKNVSGILKAFARLGTPDVHLVIAGKLPGRDSDFTPDPRRIAGELGILDRVRFTGWMEERDKPALYSGAIALLFPSHYEGFGLPPLEALTCGTPSVVSNRSSLPEVVGAGGLCIDPDDSDALVRAMHQLLVDAPLRERLRKEGLAHARRFSWQQTAHATIQAYQGAAGPIPHSRVIQEEREQ